MLISYYENGTAIPRRPSAIIRALMGVNALFAGLILFAWTYVAFFVAEPLAWATWMPISRGYGLTGVMEYPFVMLWLFPLAGIFGAWLSLKGGRKPLAYACVAVPLAMLALVMVWFYMTPSEWH